MSSGETETPEARCARYRRRVLEISQQVTAAHVAPAFSCIEIVDALYNAVMRYDDIFIMSKGHGYLAQLVALEDKHRDPMFTQLITDYCQPYGVLGAHPDYNPGIGIHASTGSLGHGLSIAVGRAFGERARRIGLGVPRVFCVLSDGEMQEGSTWEAMMMAAKLNLYNLVAVVDCNGWGGLEQLTIPNLVARADAFDWMGWHVENGHDWYDVCRTLDRAAASALAPSLVVCDTVKGRGVSFMENEPIWHYRSPNPEEYKRAMEELSDA